MEESEALQGMLAGANAGPVFADDKHDTKEKEKPGELHVPQQQGSLLQRQGASAVPAEEEEQARFKEFYGFSKELQGEKKTRLAELLAERERLDNEGYRLFEKVSDAARMKTGKRRKELGPLISFAVSTYMTESTAIKNYITPYLEAKTPKKQKDREARERKIFSCLTKANYVYNQYWLVFSVVTDYFEKVEAKGYEKTEEDNVEEAHILTALDSIITSFGSVHVGNYDEIKLDEAVMRADAVKGMLLSRGVKHLEQTETTLERTAAISAKIGDAERVKAITTHNEKNAFSMFWIPKSLLPVEQEGDPNAPFHLSDLQMAEIDGASLSLFALSSLCESVKKERKNSAPAQLAKIFDETAFGLSGVMHRYSADVGERVKHIAADKTLNGKEKQDKVSELMSEVVELSKYYAQVTARMTEILSAYAESLGTNEPSEAEKVKFSMLEQAKTRILTINTGAGEYKKQVFKKGNLHDQAAISVQALDDMQRLAFSVFTTKQRSVDPETGELSGETLEKDKDSFSERYRREVRSACIASDTNKTAEERAQAFAAVRSEYERTHAGEIRADQARVQSAAHAMTHVSSISQFAGVLGKHIPETEMKKLDSFLVDGNKHEGVGKCRAWWIRRGHISDGQLMKAVGTHVDRLLQSAGLTDKDLSLAAGNIATSTGVLTPDLFAKKLNGKEGTPLYTKLESFKTLSEKNADRDILEYFEQIKGTISLTGHEMELPFEDPYYTQYPQALKVITMYKLIKDLSTEGKTKQEKDLNERLVAASFGIRKLYDAVLASPDYRAAVQGRKDNAMRADKNVLTSLMYKRGRFLATERMDTVLSHEEYMNHHREITEQGARIRVEQTAESKKILDAQVEKHEAKLDAFEELSPAEQQREIRKNYRLVLHRVDAYKSFEAKRRYVHREVPLGPHEKRAGEDNVNPILQASLKDLLYPYFKKARQRDLYTADADMILFNLKKYAVTTNYCGIKRGEELANLTEQQLQELSALVTTRLSTYPAFIKKVAKKLKTKPADLLILQRESVLKYMFTNSELDADAAVVMIDAMKDRERFLKENKMALLYGGSEVVNPRAALDLTKLTSSRFSSDIRAANRLERMYDTDRAVEPVCKRLYAAPPKSFYEFTLDKRYEHAQEFTEAQLIEDYKKYVKEEWYPSVAEKDEGEQLAKVRDMLAFDSFTSAKKTNAFKYYGLARYGSVLTGALGTVYKDGEQVDLLNDTDRSFFEEHLARQVIKNITEKDYLCKRYCAEKRVKYSEIRDQLQLLYNDPEFLKKMQAVVDGLSARSAQGFSGLIRRRDERVKALKDSGYALLLPLLMEHEEFTDHLIADNDEEYEKFRENYFPLIKAAIDEIERHPYTEQYLIGKKKAILDFIFWDLNQGMSADVKELKASARQQLALDDYDKTIEKTELKKGLTGKPITLGKRIRDSVTRRQTVLGDKKSKKEISMEEGNLFTMVLLYDGVAAILDDTKMDAYRARVEKNTKALNAAIETVFSEEAEKGKEYSASRAEAITKSIHQNERKNLLLTGEKEYAAGVHQQVADWFMQNEIDASILETQKSMRALMEENMQLLITVKHEGRERFSEFHGETGRMQSSNLQAYEDRVRAEGTEKANAFFARRLSELPADVRTMIENFLKKEREELPQNGALNSFYNETLTRMACHAADEDTAKAVLEMQKDHIRFSNVRTFYGVAGDFLQTCEMTKKLSERTMESVLGGLMNYYGQNLLSESDLIDEEELAAELAELFDEQKTGSEFLRLLISDSGFYGIGSDGYAPGDTPLVQADRRAFEAELEKRAGKDRSVAAYRKMDTETKLLVGHLLVRDANLYTPAGYFVKAFSKQEMQSPARTDVIMSYMQGAELAEPDYKQALDVLMADGTFSAEHFREAVSLASDIAKYPRIKMKNKW